MRLFTKKRIIALIVLIPILLALYAFLIEPYWIEVTRHRISAGISPPLKIAHLSDLHTSGLGRREKSLLAILEEEKPDLIVISGDTIANRGNYEMCREILQSLKAPLGAWLVRGNWEIFKPLEEEAAFYQSCGVKFLLNDAAEVRDNLWIIGCDDDLAGAPDLRGSLAKVPSGAYKIALFHSPSFFEAAAGAFDVAFAGHTHGGQVRLPIIGPLWLPEGSGRYLNGWYEQNGSRMYVSRGVGTSILPVRFLCRPEVAIVTIGE